MKLERFNCPSCASTDVTQQSRFEYRCAACGGAFTHVPGELVRQKAEVVAGMASCQVCGDTRSLKRCYFCGEAGCAKHSRMLKDSAGEWMLHICDRCRRATVGQAFLSAVETEERAQGELLLLRRKISEGKSALEDWGKRKADATDVILRKLVVHCLIVALASVFGAVIFQSWRVFVAFVLLGGATGGVLAVIKGKREVSLDQDARREALARDQAELGSKMHSTRKAYAAAVNEKNIILRENL